MDEAEKREGRESTTQLSVCYTEEILLIRKINMYTNENERTNEQTVIGKAYDWKRKASTTRSDLRSGTVTDDVVIFGAPP